MKESRAFPTRIAVLDDDIRFIRMVERGLEGAAMSVQPVTTLDPDEAVRVIASYGCDAALVDVYMYGEAAGFDIVRLLRSTPETYALPLLLTTGARREVGRQAAFLEEHRCEVLLKPFEITDLVRTVAALIAGQGAPARAAPGLAAVRASIPA